MKSLAGALAAVLALGAGLAGCSRGTNVSRGDAAQVLHRGIGPDLVLDPQTMADPDDLCASVLSALLEGLVSEDSVDLHPVPGVAERWDISPDGLTYTFYLRDDARWSNGDPVTAQDFIDSWHRILTPSLGAAYASQLFLIQGAEAFNKGDSDFSQVGLRARNPHANGGPWAPCTPWFLLCFAGDRLWMPVPVRTISKYGGVAARGNAWATPERWVGDGPFELKSWRHGQEIVVTRSPSYWDSGRVRLREIHFHAIDSLDAEERAFRAGQLHVTEAIPSDKIDGYRRDAPGLLRIDPLLGTYFLRVNVRHPGLADARIRLALALAVDRAAITEKLLRGGQTPASSPTFAPLASAAMSPIPSRR